LLWGKLIDHSRCIGCHACSVACKSENQVPLGVFRTWVKQVEKGQGLATRRHFGVLRCNQCENAPCVQICPTAAMHRREDGIVDFDSEICIGCKGCIQACPYDAIYIDPVDNTAAKCNFCAHRIEVGLEPACVAACPADALAVSDLEDPTSRVAQAAGRQGVAVRKPELGTRPKVFYKGADQSVLDPLAAARPGEGIWGHSRNLEPEAQGPLTAVASHPGAPAAARVAYDVPREGVPWGAKISAYMLTKAIGGGAMIVGGLAMLVSGHPFMTGAWAPLWALLGLAVATAFLVGDLKRPERFLLLLTKPQRGSWLVKGAFVLIGASTLAALWGVLALAAESLTLPSWVWQALGVASVLAGAAAAGYTAFLFGQAKGRALWQSALLLPHLVVQAMIAGSASLALVPGLVAPGESIPEVSVEWRLWALGVLLAVSLALNLLMILSELWSHADGDAGVAIRWMTSEARSGTLYLGVFALGHVFPAVALAAAFMAPGASMAVPLAGLAALTGVFLWDHLYVTAGQVPPLS
jgi:Fe-S-cluster-containing dehydrogenase component/formate-dependent nitrite reductase membrane component NrfD